jgi:hypothetical protein
MVCELMLAEAVIAAAMVLMLLGATFSLVDPTYGAFATQPELAEMHQRLRASFERIYADVLRAGSGMHQASGAVLGSVRAPVIPARVGHRYGPTAGRRIGSEALTLLYAPAEATGATTASPIGPYGGDVLLRRDEPACRGIGLACGIEADSHVLVFDQAGRSELFRVTRVAIGAAFLEPWGGGRAQAFAAGASVMPLRVRSYYWSASADELRFQDGWLTDVPLVDQVVGMSFRYFGRRARPSGAGVGSVAAGCLFPSVSMSREVADPGPDEELTLSVLGDGPWCGGRFLYDVDLFRVTRIRLELRLQVGSGQLRGTDPTIFARPGTGTRLGRLVPDLLAHVDVSLRNIPAGEE